MGPCVNVHKQCRNCTRSTGHACANQQTFWSQETGHPLCCFIRETLPEIISTGVKSKKRPVKLCGEGAT
jgi:hypothetical protein